MNKKSLNMVSEALTMNNNSNGTFKLSHLILAMLPVVLMIIFLLPRVWFGADNLRLLGATGYSGVDELASVSVVVNSQDKGDLFAHGIYGDMYYNLVNFPLTLISHFHKIPIKFIIIALRMVSLIAFALITVIIFLLANRYIGGIYAIILPGLTAILFSHANYIERASMVQPHMLSAFWAISCIYCFCRFTEDQYNVKWLIISSIFFGFMMSTLEIAPILAAIAVYLICMHNIIFYYSLKMRPFSDLLRVRIEAVSFAGFFCSIFAIFDLLFRANADIGFIPEVISLDAAVFALVVLILLFSAVIFLCNTKVSCYFGIQNIFGCLESKFRTDSWPMIVRATIKIIFEIMVFISVSYTSVVLFSPKFLRPTFFIKRYLSMGQAFTEGMGNTDASFFEPLWFKVIFTDGLGMFWSVLACCGIVIFLLIVVFDLKSNKKVLISAKAVLLLFVIGTIAGLVLFVHFVRGRYLVVLLPILLFWAVYFIRVFFGYIEGKNRYLAIVVVALMLIPAGYSVAHSLANELNVHKKRFTSVEAYPAVKLGKMMAARYSPETKILASGYSYVSPTFKNVKIVDLNMTVPELREYDPDLVVINEGYAILWREMEGDYSWYAGGYVKENREYYDGMLSEKFGYRLIASEGKNGRRFLLFERRERPKDQS